MIANMRTNSLFQKRKKKEKFLRYIELLLAFLQV